jgi:hypothetical protein
MSHISAGRPQTCLSFRCWMTVDFPLLSSPTQSTLHCGLLMPMASISFWRIHILAPFALSTRPERVWLQLVQRRARSRKRKLWQSRRDTEQNAAKADHSEHPMVHVRQLVHVHPPPPHCLPCVPTQTLLVDEQAAVCRTKISVCPLPGALSLKQPNLQRQRAHLSLPAEHGRFEKLASPSVKNKFCLFTEMSRTESCVQVLPVPWLRSVTC